MKAFKLSWSTVKFEPNGGFVQKYQIDIKEKLFGSEAKANELSNKIAEAMITLDLQNIFQYPRKLKVIIP